MCTVLCVKATSILSASFLCQPYVPLLKICIYQYFFVAPQKFTVLGRSSDRWSGWVGCTAACLTINTLAMIYCYSIYQLRVKSTQCMGERGNEEKLYEQVDDQQHAAGVVVMKQNKAYGELSRQITHTSHTTRL